MYGYEGIKDTFPRQTVTDTVPTDAETPRRLLQLLSVGSRYQIYDPATIASAPNGRFSRQPLPGNVIPQSRIAPLALSVQKYWPAANLPGTRDGSNNYRLVPDVDDFWSHVFRVDHNISEKNRFFLRGDANRRRSDTENRYGNDAYGTSTSAVISVPASITSTSSAPISSSTPAIATPSTTTIQDPRSMGTDIKALGFSDAYVSQVKSISPSAVSLPYINVGGFG